MSTSTDIRTINCTQCGAPLELHGGHRVRSLNCGYCGSVMDAHEDYKVVHEHSNRERPWAHLKIGMKGKIKNVEFTIIGMLEYTCKEDGEEYKWVDFQLFSPTHGYTFLSYEDGEYTFSRRTRDIPDPEKITRYSEPDYIRACGRRMKFDEAFTAEISFVEGELTWIAKIGDKVEVAEASKSPYSFSYEQTEDELEYSFGQTIPVRKVHQAFGVEKPDTTPRKSRKTTSSSSPKTSWSTHLGNWNASLRKVAGWYTLFALAVVLVLSIFGGGNKILEENITNPLTPQVTKAFTISNHDNLIKLYLETSLQDSWADYSVTITRKKDNESIFGFNRNLEFYSGYEGGEYWSEGSNTAEALFKVPAAGEYYLEVEAEGETTTLPSLKVYIYEGVLPARYVLAFMVFSIVCFFFGLTILFIAAIGLSIFGGLMLFGP